MGIIEATRGTRANDLEDALFLLAENGSVVVGGFAVNQPQTWSFSETLTGDADGLEDLSVNPPDIYGFGHKSYYEHIARCIESSSRHLPCKVAYPSPYVILG